MVGMLAASAPLLTIGHSQAAQIRCASDGYFKLPQDDGRLLRLWPSGVRPTKETCHSGFIFGPITKGDYQKVLALYRGSHPFLGEFALASPGGDVLEAIKIGRLFRKYLISTFFRRSVRVLALQVRPLTSLNAAPLTTPTTAIALALAPSYGSAGSTAVALLVYIAHERTIPTLRRLVRQKEPTHIVEFSMAFVCTWKKWMCHPR
jgi:hypothetical protein